MSTSGEGEGRREGGREGEREGEKEGRGEARGRERRRGWGEREGETVRGRMKITRKRTGVKNAGCLLRQCQGRVLSDHRVHY